MKTKVIAWDFDGVLNRNVNEGRFLWSETFEADLGHPVQNFVDIVFAPDFDDVITGRVDLRDRVAAWVDAVGYSGSTDDVLTYWFEKDALPDPEMLALMGRARRAGLRQVVVTNNEARRTAYIMDQMGFAKRVERIFSSGLMGLRKPDPDYFRKVTNTLNVTPQEMLLIDDVSENIETAQSLGWKTVLVSEEARELAIARISDHIASFGA